MTCVAWGLPTEEGRSLVHERLEKRTAAQADEGQEQQAYSRQEIETILGAAAREQAERTGAEGIEGGLPREKALEMAHELAEALNLDHSLVQSAFEAHESDALRRRMLMKQLDIRVHPMGIARRLMKEIREALTGHEDLVVRAVASKHVIDPKRHEEMEVLRTIVTGSTLLPFSNRAGTVPSISVVAYVERRAWRWMFGLIPFYGKVYTKFVTLEIVPLEGKSVIMGVLHHDAMLEALAPILEGLQDDVPEVALGKLEVDYSSML